MHFDVFLSHDSRDYDLTYRVWGILSYLGIAAYMYEVYPQYGEYLPEVIKSVMKDSRYVVVFFTRNGVSSQWVNQEVGMAIGGTRPFQSITIPVLETSVTSRGFTEPLVHIDYDPRNPESMIYDLLRTLREKCGKAGRIPSPIDCSCGQSVPAFIPSLDDINRIIQSGRSVFTTQCTNCGKEHASDVWTCELLP